MNNLTRYPTLDELARYLEASRMLSPEEVARRAEFVFEDIRRLPITGFALVPPRALPVPGTDRKFLTTEYTFGPVRFDIENAKDPFSISKRVEEIGGTGLNCEDLLYLSRICEIGRTLIPDKWFNDSKLIADIREPGKHLDTLNEVWWLSRWSGFSEQELERESIICPSGTRSIDWRFPLMISGRKWFLNLEVKRLIRSIADRSYKKSHRFYTTTRPDGTLQKDDPARKFRDSLSNEVNVLAITWFDQISDELETDIEQFLVETNKIDAVLIWAPGDRRRGGVRRVFPKSRELADKRTAIHLALTEPSEEDEARIMVNLFPRTIQSILEEARTL